MNHTERTQSVFSHILLWFGAAVSIAEIAAGTLIAPLGIGKGILSIVIGHIIGGIILFSAGFIGAKSGLTAAESVRISFGKYGSFGFSILNILQLLGWTAVMIINGAQAFNGIAVRMLHGDYEKLWCILIGGLICCWIILGLKNLTKVNSVVCLVLFLFFLALGINVFTQMDGPTVAETSMGFGEAVELNVAMALSWLPLISDYTCKLEKPFIGTVGSVLSYSCGSALMFIIGVGAAVHTGKSDITSIMIAAGMGSIALMAVVFSTVTTTFLDTYSAGISATNLNEKINYKLTAIVVCVAGTLISIFVPITQYEDFLYLIGSVFAPLFSILFVDYYLFKKREKILRTNCLSVVLWIIGFFIYRLLLPYNSYVGITLPIMLLTGALYIIISKIFRGNNREKECD